MSENGDMVARFEANLKNESFKRIAEAGETVRALATEAFADLESEARKSDGYGSPVASGRLAGSFRLAINGTDTSVEPPDPDYRYPPGKGARPLPPRTIGNVATSNVINKLRGFKLGDSITISNSVPYIRKIELGGYSWQTPDGVFEPTIRRLLSKFSAAIGKFTTRG